MANKKPNFDPGAAFWLDPDFIAAPDRERLAEYLPRTMSSANKEAFMAAVSERAHLVKETLASTPSAKVRARLKQVISEVRRLQQALVRLEGDTLETFECYFDELVWLSDPPVPLATCVLAHSHGPTPLALREFLSQVWDGIDDLAKAAEYAAGCVNPSRQGKPTADNGRQLVFLVAEAYRARFGQLPPHSKETWFPLFMEQLGGHLNLPCGQELVHSVVRRMERQPS